MVVWTLVAAVVSFLGSVPDRTILQFGSSQCVACQQLQPAVDQLVSEGWIVRYYDTDRDRAAADRWQVRQIPTLIVLEKGREVDRIVGAHAPNDLKSRLKGSREVTSSIESDRGIPKPSDRAQPNRLASQRTTEAREMVSLQQTGVQLASAQFPVDSKGVRPMGVESAVLPQASIPSMDRVDPMSATVRIRIDDRSTESVGTGTIIDTHGEEALVLTCGHLFRESRGKAPISIEIFEQGRPIKVAGTLIDFRADEVDIGLVSFKTPCPVSVARLLPKGVTLQERLPVFSIGCDGGANPTRRDSQITKLNRYLGPSNIETAGAPVQGRSGGGLFDAQGQLIGVCYAADKELNEGLYSGPDVVYAQLERLGLKRLYDRAQDRPNEAAPVRTASYDNDGFPRQTRGLSASQMTDAMPSQANGQSTGRREIIAIVREPGKQELVLSIPNAPAPLMDMLQNHGVVQNTGAR